jgi:protein-tyrosine phosphatase
MTHPFDILHTRNGVSMIFTPCPGTKNTTGPDAVASLKKAGAHALITLMPTHEMTHHKADTLPNICADLDMAWFHLPIEDDSLPKSDFEIAFEKNKASLLDMLKNNQTVAIHCRGGSGRTGFMAAILLLELGLDWLTVRQQIQHLRPKALQKADQLTYLKNKYQIMDV